MRGKSRVALLALAVAALVPSLGVAQYAPKWHVGDWWIVKTWRRAMMSPRQGWRWDYLRYDVVRTDKVGENDCYVIELRGDVQPNIGPDGTAGRALYVRTDNWLVVRTEEARFYGGKRISTDVRDYPRGIFGPFISEPRLPRFPLQPMNQDTAFERKRRDDCYADLREIARPADPGLVRRLFDEGDTSGSRVIRPTGAVYEVRSELASDFAPGSLTERKFITQSLQLWSDDLPWRPFEEFVRYSGPNRSRGVTERSWLIAVGKREK